MKNIIYLESFLSPISALAEINEILQVAEETEEEYFIISENIEQLINYKQKFSCQKITFLLKI